ncbi:NAD(P)/FAD-dependent oxidoreductase [Paenibacillus sp. NPDC056579]|uniref:NAD(P)/FAD-dependent oxidoreductase n=1 Tax=Paenibacillus sp. NPDC056579 TaxID=3345871 RepID=UPI0036B20A1C
MVISKEERNVRKEGKAIIMGGSMAGLLTARVLSDLFEDVVIVDRDEFPDEPVNRAGTPHANHPHRLLQRGKVIFEELFPGYTDELHRNGAFAREGKTVHFTNQYGTLEMPETEKDMGFSRALFEWVIRQRISALANVRFLPRHEVSGLQSSADGTSVTGVYVRERGKTGEAEALVADLVVDASGRSSKVVPWLQSLGYEVPEAERLKVSLGYSTRHYKLSAQHADRWSVILVDAVPAKKIGTGALGTIENQIAEVSLYCAGGEAYPTTDADRYEEEAARLLSPVLADVLKELEPVGNPRGYRVPECFRQHFEQMSSWPSGLFVLGDAFCNFDPIYGQGMTIAAIEAQLLGKCLQEQRCKPKRNFELDVFAQIQKAIEPAWWMSLVADLRWSGVEYSGPASKKGIAFAQQYFDLYLGNAVGSGNGQLLEKYYDVTGMMISLREIMNPETIVQVLALDETGEAQRLSAEFFGEEGKAMEKELERLIPLLAM